MIDFNFVTKDLSLPASTPDFKQTLKKTIGRQISRWMIGATLIYVGIFYYVLNDSAATYASVIALAFHLIALLWHTRGLSWASTWSLLVAVFHLAYLDIFVLHTTLTIYLWMACIPPFAMLACSTMIERVTLATLTPAAAVACLIVSAQGEFETSFYLGVVSIIGSTLLLTYITRWSLELIERSHLMLREEYQRSERILLNVLPEEVIARLKETNSSIQSSILADNYQHASVLFADIVGFTALSARLSPNELVQILNRYFTAFDELSIKHNVEKIKTIGDAYMVASGILREDEAALDNLARFSLDMLSETERINSELALDLSLRVGIHCGPVTAGVIGAWKFIYDLWGDTVNVASRMESHGEPGHVHVSSAVRDALSERFEFVDHGVRVIKGKGEMQTFLLMSER